MKRNSLVVGLIAVALTTVGATSGVLSQASPPTAIPPFASKGATIKTLSFQTGEDRYLGFKVLDVEHWPWLRIAKPNDEDHAVWINMAATLYCTFD